MIATFYYASAPESGRLRAGCPFEPTVPYAIPKRLSKKTVIDVLRADKWPWSQIWWGVIFFLIVHYKPH